MQIIDTSRVFAPLRETSVSLERCHTFAFDFVFGAGENAFLSNTAHSEILRVEVHKHRPARYETRVENAIGAKPAQSEDFTSGNPDYVYRAIRNGNK